MSSRNSSALTALKISPAYSTDTTALYGGDVLDLGPQIAAACQASGDLVDAVITDPPYCSGGATTAARTGDPAKKYCQNGDTLGRPTFGGDSRDQRGLKYWSTLWMLDARSATREGGYILCFTDWRQIPTFSDALQAAGWTWRGVATWNKGRGARAPHKGYLRHQCEYIVWGTNGPCERRIDAGPFDGAYGEPVRRDDKFHITGKPTRLLQQLVQIAPAKRDDGRPGLVFDPFAGSSTSGVACQLEGRRWIGCELSDEYVTVSADRLRA